MKEFTNNVLKVLLISTSISECIEKLTGLKNDPSVFSHYLKGTRQWSAQIKKLLASREAYETIVRSLSGRNHFEFLELAIKEVQRIEKTRDELNRESFLDSIEKLREVINQSYEISLQRKCIAAIIQEILCFLTSNGSYKPECYDDEILSYVFHLKRDDYKLDAAVADGLIYTLNKGTPFFDEDRIKIKLHHNEAFILSTSGESNIICPDTDWDDCRCFLEEYSEIFTRRRKDVLYDLVRCSNGTRENSKIVGIKKSLHKPGCLAIDLYKTDYFTHRLIETVLADTHTNMRIEDTEYCKKGFMRTSLGINVLLRIPHNNKIILAKRSSRAAYGNEGKLYPSVVETLDLEHKDFDPKYANPIIACVMRGLEEELGVPDFISNNLKQQMYDISNVRIRSLFYTKKYRQDNVFTIVTLNPDSTFEQLINCTRHGAQDYALESSGIVALEDDANFIERFIENNRENMIEQTYYCLCDYVWLIKNKAI